MKGKEKQRVLECYQRHKDMIYKLAWAYCKDRYQADDVFQEVFFKYLKYHNMRKPGSSAQPSMSVRIC